MIKECKHCLEKFDVSNKPKGWIANHSRWCNSNPKRSSYHNAMSIARAAKTPEGRIVAAEKVKVLHKEGKYAHVDRMNFLGKKHTIESKQLMREKALASPHRRLKKGMIEYKGIWLDSSWELALAKRLDFLSINWIRPGPIPWIDEAGVTHNYFGDFYLPDYNLYLDPKNPQAIKVQKKKLDCLLSQYNNIVIIDSLEGCTNYNSAGMV